MQPLRSLPFVQKQDNPSNSPPVSMCVCVAVSQDPWSDSRIYTVVYKCSVRACERDHENQQPEPFGRYDAIGEKQSSSPSCCSLIRADREGVGLSRGEPPSN